MRAVTRITVTLGLGLGFMLTVPAHAQGTKAAPTPTTRTAATPARGKTGARAPLDAKTTRELTQRLTTHWEHMQQPSRIALAHSMWGLHQALKDPGPFPYVTPRAPVEPPAAVACTDCGKRQAYPADPCKGLRDELKEIMRKQILKGLIINQLQNVLQVLADMEFYGGVASLVGDIVSTTTALVTAGAGGALGKAATNALKDIATDQIKGAIMDAVIDALPAPLNTAASGKLTEAGLNGIIGQLTSQISALNAEKVAKIKALNECAKNYSQSLKTIDTNNANVADCMGKTPNYCL